MPEIHGIAADWHTTLVSGINNSQASFDVVDATGHPDTPFYFNISAERLECTDVTGDTLTVVRGVLDSSATTHTVAEIVEQVILPVFWTEISGLARSAEAMIVDMLGRRNGVQKTFPDEDNLEVTSGPQPNLTVDIGRGSALVNENIATLFEATEITLTAPSGPEWIALIQINEASEIVVKYEVVTPPTVDADAIALAQYTITTAGAIISGIDRREFL